MAAYFVLWYGLNIAYNIYNKVVLNTFPLPYTVATIQLGCGLLWILPLWALGLRSIPKLESSAYTTFFPIALFHTLGHTLTVISLGAGSVSFTHIVKASEPFFSSLITAVMGTISPWQVNMCLVPVVGGVIMASLKELSFTWQSFNSALGSNLSFAVRGIFSKKAMINSATLGKDLTPPNIFAVLTIMSFLLMLPVSWYMERDLIPDALDEAYGTFEGGQFGFWKYTMLCGLFYYLYNECAYLVLGCLDSAVSAAVGNTVKRVVVLVATTVYFQTEMSSQSMLGCAIAIGGTFLYSIVGARMKERLAQASKGKKKKM